jgi:prepilin-type N-terminal cleavage/methylation domain-containing protein
MPAERTAFTLVELLVVVTIIVILLALLVPALDRAIYSAELAVCGAQLRGVSAGAVAYTFDNKRLYPARVATQSLATGNYYVRNITLPFGIHNKDNALGYDDRPLLRPYMSLDALQCPPAGNVSISGSKDGTQIFSSYALWFGWQYIQMENDIAGERSSGTVATRYKGMFRVGDRWEFKSRDSSNREDIRAYSALAGDWFVRGGPFGFQGMVSAHNGRNPLMINFRRQDQTWNPDNPADAVVTISDWSIGGDQAPQLEGHDINFTFSDNSVQRIDYAQWYRSEGIGAEPRLHGVGPFHKGGSGLLAVPGH